MRKNLFPPNGGSPLSSPRLKAGASRGHLVNDSRRRFTKPGGSRTKPLTCLALRANLLDPLLAAA